MNYATVCSGIEAPSQAWDSLGWTPQWFSEIEPFPSALLSHHYPHVPNLGDMTKIHHSDVFKQSTINLLCGGTPCQSFSVAGLRKGLDDPRGNLMLTFLSLADRKRPKWILWENVPGVLSSNGGRDFGAFLGGLAELGYGWAYRVLDAQYYGVAQRRRRVFVVGCLGDYRSAAAVLFERHSLSGYPPPSRKKGQEVTQVAGTLTANGGGLNRPAGNANELDFCVAVFDPNQITSKTNRSQPTPELCHTLPASSTPPIAFGIDEECNVSDNHFGPLLRGGQGGTRQAVAFAQNTRDEFREMSVVGALAASPGMKQTSYIRQDMTVRRLTPIEAERLQGFPDSYTDIQPKGKPTPDGARYKALGNSMAVPVIKWIGQRIQMVENL